MESLLSALPVVLLLLICPLAMLFMMRGAHGGHAGGHPHAAPEDGRLRALEAEVAELRQAAGRAPEAIATSGNGSGQPPVEVEKG